MAMATAPAVSAATAASLAARGLIVMRIPYSRLKSTVQEGRWVRSVFDRCPLEASNRLARQSRWRHGFASFRLWTHPEAAALVSEGSGGFGPVQRGGTRLCEPDQPRGDPRLPGEMANGSLG
ncbi:hypothetical protein GCM10018790_34950 [Kitasatospora xanthocidica]|nr:hypothetical protein GCM10018790_34950 [Kitasatospora xanthocidica]